MTLLSILVFVFIFSLLILIHEWGHFTAARRSGVKVEEFGIGLPPRLWGKQKGETLYSINAIPFGGFVRMLGEDGGAASKKNKRSFFNQSLGKQAFIVSAGVIMNLLLAWVLLTGGFLFGMEPLLATSDDFLDAIREDVVHVEVGPAPEDERIFIPRLVFEQGLILLSANETPVLEAHDLEALLMGQSEVSGQFYDPLDGKLHEETIAAPEAFDGFETKGAILTATEPDSPAERAGLQAGDQLLTLNGTPIVGADQVVELTQSAKSGPLRYEILRGEEYLIFEIEPRSDGRVGIAIADLYSLNDNPFYEDAVEHHYLGVEEQQYTWQAPLVALKEMWRLGKITAVTFVQVLGRFLTGGGVPEGVSGPVGIAQLTALSVQEGFGSVVRLVALLSLSLGVLNILPLPALDGGRLFFILVQAITGKKPSPRIEYLVHTAGLFLLLAFITYITFNDVLNLL